MKTRFTRRTGVLALVLSVLVAGAALSRPAHNGFDLSGSLVPPEEIHLGGPPRDGIPAIDRPRFLSAGQAEFLAPDDRVLGLARGGEAKAYPIRILNWHEIVNDRIGGERVAVTYCPLCGTGVAFRARAEGRELTFGVSGLLYNSDVLLYDRETESLWSQIRKQAITGDMRGTRLTALPLVHTSWEAWRTEHPDTRVLSTDTGHDRNYWSNPYSGYQSDAGLEFPVSARSARYHPKERVLGVELGGTFKAYPFAELSRVAGGEVRDRIAGREVRVRFDPEGESARAFDADGRELPAITGFWFAWYAFHPETEVFTAGG
jgi:hypothetical protein